MSSDIPFQATEAVALSFLASLDERSALLLRETRAQVEETLLGVIFAILTTEESRSVVRPFVIQPPSTQSELTRLYEALQRIVVGNRQLGPFACDNVCARLHECFAEIRAAFSEKVTRKLEFTLSETISRFQHQQSERVADRIAFSKAEFNMSLSRIAQYGTSHGDDGAASLSTMPNRKLTHDEALRMLSASLGREKAAQQQAEEAFVEHDSFMRNEERNRQLFMTTLRREMEDRMRLVDLRLTGLQNKIQQLHGENLRLTKERDMAINIVRRLDERCAQLSLQLNAAVSDAQRSGALSPDFARMQHAILAWQREKNASGEEQVKPETLTALGLSLKSTLLELPSCAVSLQQQELLKSFIRYLEQAHELKQQQKRADALERRVSDLQKEFLAAKAKMTDDARRREADLHRQLVALSDEVSKRRQATAEAFATAREASICRLAAGDAVVDDLTRRLKKANAELNKKSFDAFEAHEEKAADSSSPRESKEHTDVDEKWVEHDVVAASVSRTQPTAPKPPSLGFYLKADDDALTKQLPPYRRQLRAAHASLAPNRRPLSARRVPTPSIAKSL